MAESLAGGTRDIASATVTSLTQIHMPIIPILTCYVSCLKLEITEL